MAVVDKPGAVHAPRGVIDTLATWVNGVTTLLNWTRERSPYPPCVVADLPDAELAGMGARGFVTDANATTFASTVAGGGSNKVPVYSNETDWKIG